MTNKKLKDFVLELINHLEYCGWSWEKKCSIDLQIKVDKYKRSLENDRNRHLLKGEEK